MEEKEKSFSELSKGFLSDWKKDYAEENKEIMDRKKKRDEETAQLKVELENQISEYKKHLHGKSKELFDNMSVYFKAFAEEVQKGTATLSQKIQLEKRLEELGDFMKKAGEKGAEKYEEFSKKFKQKLDEFDKEIISKKEISNDEKFEKLQQEADDLLKKSKKKDISDLFD